MKKWVRTNHGIFREFCILHFWLREKETRWRWFCYIKRIRRQLETLWRNQLTASLFVSYGYMLSANIRKAQFQGSKINVIGNNRVYSHHVIVFGYTSTFFCNLNRDRLRWYMNRFIFDTQLPAPPTCKSFQVFTLIESVNLSKSTDLLEWYLTLGVVP